MTDTSPAETRTPDLRDTELERLKAEIAWLRAGESEKPAALGVEMTPAEFIHKWNAATVERRLGFAATVLEKVYAESNCFVMAHEARIEEDAHRIEQLAKRAEEAEAALAFVHGVLALFAKADVQGLLWFYGEGDGVCLAADVSDVFAWGGADCEPITPDRLPLLQQAYDDLAAFQAWECMPELYAARIRGMRPQGAAYPTSRNAQALFDACGPVRETGLGNPKPQPEPSD
jgi:hypothetical protein